MILDLPASLREDLVTLRKLRDESECDELKQAFSSEDPRQWKIQFGDVVTVADGRVTQLLLMGCLSLAALPAAIDGTAVWTLLTDPKEVKRVLDARARERREETKRR